MRTFIKIISVFSVTIVPAQTWRTGRLSASQRGSCDHWQAAEIFHETGKIVTSGQVFHAHDTQIMASGCRFAAGHRRQPFYVFGHGVKCRGMRDLPVNSRYGGLGRMKRAHRFASAARSWQDEDSSAMVARWRHAVQRRWPGAMAPGNAMVRQDLAELDQMTTISKSSLRAPHSGQVQFIGTCSHGVPGAMPSSGKPSASL